MYCAMHLVFWCVYVCVCVRACVRVPAGPGRAGSRLGEIGSATPLHRLLPEFNIHRRKMDINAVEVRPAKILLQFKPPPSVAPPLCVCVCARARACVCMWMGVWYGCSLISSTREHNNICSILARLGTALGGRKLAKFKERVRAYHTNPTSRTAPARAFLYARMTHIRGNVCSLLTELCSTSGRFLRTYVRECSFL